MERIQRIGRRSLALGILAALFLAAGQAVAGTRTARTSCDAYTCAGWHDCQIYCNNAYGPGLTGVCEPVGCCNCLL